MKRLKSTLPFLVAIALSYIYPFDFAKRECPLTYPISIWHKIYAEINCFWQPDSMMLQYAIKMCINFDLYRSWFSQLFRLLLVWAMLKFWRYLIVLERTEILYWRWKYSMVISWYCFLQFWRISAMLWSLKRWLMFCKTRFCHLKGGEVCQWRLEAQVFLSFVWNDNFRYLILMIILNLQLSCPIQANHW